MYIASSDRGNIATGDYKASRAKPVFGGQKVNFTSHFMPIKKKKIQEYNESGKVQLFQALE